MEIGDVIRLKDGKAVYRIGEDVVHVKDDDRWLKSPETTWEMLQFAVDNGFAVVASDDERRHPFQKLPDSEMPLMYSTSGERSMALHDAVDLIQMEADRAWYAAQATDAVDAARQAARLDRAVEAIKSFIWNMPETVTRSPAHGRVWSMITGVKSKLNDDGYYESMEFPEEEYYKY